MSRRQPIITRQVAKRKELEPLPLDEKPKKSLKSKVGGKKGKAVALLSTPVESQSSDSSSQDIEVSAREEGIFSFDFFNSSACLLLLAMKKYMKVALSSKRKKTSTLKKTSTSKSEETLADYLMVC